MKDFKNNFNKVRNNFLKFVFIFQLMHFQNLAWADIHRYDDNKTDNSSPHFIINPSNLRKYILEGNNSVLLGLNAIYQSKDQVNIARANLLPSLNLNTLGGPTGFNLSTVSFLLPFLAPSNWFNLEQSELLLEAEKDAYYVIQLNVYASALGLYQTLVGDLALREVYHQNYLVLKKIAEVIERQSQEIGANNSQDVIESKAQVNMAMNNLIEFDKLLLQERAALRKSLGLEAGLEKSITIEPIEISSSPYEMIPMQKALDAAQLLAPEKRQLQNLKAAAESSKWSTIFAFMGAGGGALSANSGASPSASFQNISGSYSFNLTFATVPSVHLTNDHIAMLKLREDELYIEQRATVESTIGSIALVKKQIEQAELALEKFTQIYEIEYEKYNMGMSELLDLLSAQANRTNAAALVVQNKTDLNTLRVNLHRLTLTDEFLKIKGCTLDRRAARATRRSGFFDWFKEIFDPKLNHSNINAICKK